MVKSIHKQKTFWSGIALIVAGLGGMFTGDMALFEALQTIFMGFMAIFLRQAVNENK